MTIETGFFCFWAYELIVAFGKFSDRKTLHMLLEICNIFKAKAQDIYVFGLWPCFFVHYEQKVLN